MTGSVAGPGLLEPALLEEGGGEFVSVSLGLLICRVMSFMPAVRSSLRGDRPVGSIFWCIHGGGFSCRPMYAVL
ncbi:protein of unknown function [Candidatus Nitrospira inopinata]|jgi:hypothetical protein|uniref:Uncharacterized protein n=1 Tax=Candidatus Nitrospira inopinata TaxID=1715989 RepID=A0A0S4KQA5_9BACT|nr:protein of unknown function [Candidatus Nitrospira inopinata]